MDEYAVGYSAHLKTLFIRSGIIDFIEGLLFLSITPAMAENRTTIIEMLPKKSFCQTLFGAFNFKQKI